MGEPRRSRRARLADALIWGTLLGASSGAVLGAAVDGVGAVAGAVAGAAVMACVETLVRVARGAGQPPLWSRILASGLLMALVGWALGLVCGSGEPVLTGVVCGGLVGLLGLRPLKLALGLAIGAGVGLVLHGAEPALVAAAVTVAYRVAAALAYRGRPLVRIMAEEVPAAQLLYVVPFEARTKYVGADYVEQLAAVRGGTFRRNIPDVGIIASLDALAGPTLDPSRVHPLIREFYEHTSRFTLSIVPEWRPWMKPPHELFKRFVAQPLGQATIPSNIEEAQRWSATPSPS